MNYRISAEKKKELFYKSALLIFFICLFYHFWNRYESLKVVGIAKASIRGHRNRSGSTTQIIDYLYKVNEKIYENSLMLNESEANLLKYPEGRFFEEIWIAYSLKDPSICKVIFDSVPILPHNKR
jgi:hypothetical protein